MQKLFYGNQQIYVGKKSIPIVELTANDWEILNENDKMAPVLYLVPTSEGRKFFFKNEPVNKIEYGDTLTKKDGVLDVLNAVKDVVTPLEYNNMSDEERNHGVFIIHGVDEHPVYGLTIEEYDTVVDECNWHVRKWSNGYVELFGRKSYNLDITTEWVVGYNWHRSDATIGVLKYPFPLVEIYNENAIANNSNIATLVVTVPNNQLSLLEYTSPLLAIRPFSTPDVSFVLNVSVTGRWKEETPSPNTLETKQVLTSVVLPETSGDVEVDDTQYHFEVPNADSIGSMASASSTASMASFNMNAEGSSADMLTYNFRGVTVDESEEIKE